MTLYTRHQLLLVLLLVGAAGAGLAIDHWRRASPELVERLERLDRVERTAPPEPAPREPRRAPEGARGRERAGREARGAVRPPDGPLDVNHASAPELARLPGIGSTLATRIVQARPFASLDDLARVPGLRRATLERVRPLVLAQP